MLQIPTAPTAMPEAGVVPNTLQKSPKLLNLKEGISDNIQNATVLGTQVFSANFSLQQ
jgi:hypothetical protein